MHRFDTMGLRTKRLLNFLVSGGVLVAAILFCTLKIEAVGHDTERKKIVKSLGNLDGEMAGALKQYQPLAISNDEVCAIAHETSRAAESMAGTAHGMEAMVSRFRV